MVPSTKAVPIPKKAETHIQNKAPGPPTEMAPVTPRMFPGPTRMAELSIKAARGDIPVSALRRRIRRRMASPMWVSWMQWSRRVK